MQTIYDKPWLYDLLVRPDACERFYGELARSLNGPVLELACGTGRLTVPLARSAIGVTSLDCSRRMLTVARKKLRETGTSAELIHDDMRSFNLGRRFSLIMMSCNSLAHLTEPDEIVSFLRVVRSHLSPSGRLAFDIVNPQLPSLAAPSIRRIVTSHQGLVVFENSSYDPVSQISTVSWELSSTSGRGGPVAPVLLRQVFPQELLLLLTSAGLKLEARWGDFDGAEFTGTSSNQICVASIA